MIEVGMARRARRDARPTAPVHRAGPSRGRPRPRRGQNGSRGLPRQEDEVKRVRVVTDSTADMDQEEIDRLGIEVVPHTVLWNGESYLDRVDLDIDEFYRRLREERGTPRTSQPSVGQFERAYRRVLEDAGGIVSLHVSGKLSGTCSTAELAARNVAPDRIVVLDSMTLTGCLGMLATRVAEMGLKGASLMECVSLAEGLIPRLRLFIVLDTLEFLRRGGRIGRVQAVAGNLLSIKPIIQVLGGVFLPVDRVRTRAAAIRRAARLIESLGPLEEVLVQYGDNPDPARQLFHLIREALPDVKLDLGRTGPACGTHGGPGVFGASVLLAQ